MPMPESGGCVAFYRYANEPCYTWVSHHLSSTAVSQSLDPSEQSNLWETQGINLSDDRYSQKKGLPHKYAPNFTKKGGSYCTYYSIDRSTFYWLVSIPDAEGYSSEPFDGENAALQVAYPGYRDALQWLSEHTHGTASIGLLHSH